MFLYPGCNDEIEEGNWATYKHISIMWVWQMKCGFEQDLWNTIWWWWMHSASSLKLNKDCWHRGRHLQAYLSNHDLIHACTESHCDIYNSLPLPLPPLSVSLCHAGSIACAMCYPFRWKINYNSFISKGSRSQLLTQIGRLCLYPEDMHFNREDSLMLFILRVN